MKAIATVFKGIKLKSRLEADTAYLIDGLGYKWQYEPQSYLLESGIHYWPDFYIPELKLIIECRGYETDKGEAQIEGFAKMINNGEIGPDLVTRPQIPEGCEFAYSDVHKEYVDYLVIGPNDVRFYECYARFGVNTSYDVALIQCSKCGHWYFGGLSGSYQCRYCGEWDGNKHFHDMRYLQYEDGVISIGYTLKLVKDFIKELDNHLKFWLLTKKDLEILGDGTLVLCKRYGSEGIEPLCECEGVSCQSGSGGSFCEQHGHIESIPDNQNYMYTICYLDEYSRKLPPQIRYKHRGIK
ncbi:MAG: hypothetical protein WC749_02520 [Dehalococcoidia bacterium]